MGRRSSASSLVIAWNALRARLTGHLLKWNTLRASTRNTHLRRTGNVLPVGVRITMKCGTSVVVSALAVLTVAVGHAEEGPRIEMFSPQGKVKGVRQVSVRFSEPMVPLGDPSGLVEPFDIVCRENATARWADSRNWVFDFARDLPAGVRCEFSVKAGRACGRGSGKAALSFGDAHQPGLGEGRGVRKRSGHRPRPGPAL